MKHFATTLIIMLCCLPSTQVHARQASQDKPRIKAGEIGQLAKPVSNNAVAAAKTPAGWQLFSFNGLQPGKDWQAVTNAAMSFDLTTSKSTLIDSVPYQAGRLASVAATVNNKIYLFGGYTVAANHEEKSMADVYQFDPQTRKFTLFSKMPIPVDDSIALVYQQRYIYLISGWHDVGNITDVQILDTQTKQWLKGTAFPGKPVFGHAGGIVANQMVVVDGVKVAAVVDGKRQYKMSLASYLGIIDPLDVTKINWRQLPAHPGKGKYRMAATGIGSKGKILFAGGSDNPYNFNGIGYNGTPSEPSNAVFAWDITSSAWQVLKPLTQATMDHRALLEIDGQLYIVGGMLAGQKVSNKIFRYAVE